MSSEKHIGISRDSSHAKVRALVEGLGLQPHPEGGYFRETYRSGDLFVSEPSRFSGPRPASTAIYYLLARGDYSAFHRIRSDEMWHFYSGDPLCVHVIHTDLYSGDVEKTPAASGCYERVLIGKDLLFQAVVPAGAWFAAEPLGEYSLVGCTVSPGFDFEDFEMARGEELLREFPDHADLIRRLTR